MPSTHELRMDGDTLAIRLNRIARQLRHMGRNENPREFVERIADEVEMLLYEAAEPAPPDEIGRTLSGAELMRDYLVYQEWANRLHYEQRRDVDALLQWWRRGFDELPESAENVA